MMIKIQSLYNTLIFFLVLLSMITPIALTKFKFSLIFLLLLIIGREALVGNYKIDRGVFYASFFFSIIGLVWINLGVINSNPGAHVYLNVLFLYPIVFTILLSNIKNVSYFMLIKFFRIVAVCLALSQLVFILSKFSVIPYFISDLYSLLYPDTSNFTRGSGFFIFSLPNISTSIFFVSFFLAMVMFSRRLISIDFLIFCTLLILVLLTGRRAIFVSLFFSVFFVLGFSLWFEFHFKRVISRILAALILPTIIALSLLSYFDVNLSFVVEGIISILDFKSDSSNLERVYQFEALLEGVYDSPLYGQGAGAVANYIRSGESPWNYELFYVNMLFQLGILGFLFYSVGVIVMTFKALSIPKVFHNHHIVMIAVGSILSGFLGFMVANASNPYLLKFDYMWVFFIVAFIWSSFSSTSKV